MLDVTNTGDRAGDEVVQIYTRDPTASLPRPEKELKGFARISLQPGETGTVTHELDMRALAFFDDAQAAWIAEAGTFDVLVGASSEDIRARASFRLTADWRQPVGMTNHETMTATRV
jgi:beta-glucosidase